MITSSAHAHRPSRRLAGVLLIGGSMAASLLSASPALAGTPSAAQSCWENIDTGEKGCFASGLDPREQIELATGRPLVATETERMGAARAAASQSAAADYLLVTGWDGINKTGDSKSYLTSNATVCTGTFVYGFGSLVAWNDRFESIQSFNGCLTTLYDDIAFDGAFTGPISSSNDLGAFKNRASSLEVG